MWRKEAATSRAAGETEERGGEAGDIKRKKEAIFLTFLREKQEMHVLRLLVKGLCWERPLLHSSRCFWGLKRQCTLHILTDLSSRENEKAKKSRLGAFLLLKAGSMLQRGALSASPRSAAEPGRELHPVRAALSLTSSLGSPEGGCDFFSLSTTPSIC